MKNAMCQARVQLESQIKIFQERPYYQFIIGSFFFQKSWIIQDIMTALNFLLHQCQFFFLFFSFFPK